MPEVIFPGPEGRLEGRFHPAPARAPVAVPPGDRRDPSRPDQPPGTYGAILVIARAHSEAEVENLQKHGADRVIMGEREIALGMLRYAAEAEPSPDAGESGDAGQPAPQAPRDSA